MKTLVKSTDSNMTEKVAERLGGKLQGGEVIELIGDLGGGKTTFIRGLARGLGSHDRVSSPSFTLTNTYQAGKLKLYHFDFYRLDDPGLMSHELAEILTNPKSIVAIEWAVIVAKVIVKPHITIFLKQTSEKEREISFNYPKPYSYLFDDKD